MNPFWIIILIAQLWLISSMFTDEPLAVVYAWMWIGIAVWVAWIMREES